MRSRVEREGLEERVQLLTEAQEVCLPSNIANTHNSPQKLRARFEKNQAQMRQDKEQLEDSKAEVSALKEQLQTCKDTERRLLQSTNNGPRLPRPPSPPVQVPGRENSNDRSPSYLALLLSAPLISYSLRS